MCRYLCSCHIGGVQNLKRGSVTCILILYTYYANDLILSTLFVMVNGFIFYFYRKVRTILCSNFTCSIGLYESDLTIQIYLQKVSAQR